MHKIQYNIGTTAGSTGKLPSRRIAGKVPARRRARKISKTESDFYARSEKSTGTKLNLVRKLGTLGKSTPIYGRMKVPYETPHRVGFYSLYIGSLYIGKYCTFVCGTLFPRIKQIDLYPRKQVPHTKV